MINISVSSSEESVAPALTPDFYRSFIEQAYIDPIRTVVVVDDDFPSLDGLIEKQLGGGNAWAGSDADAIKVKEILEFCRSKEKPWLVDVHDGREFQSQGDQAIAPYLHHSDLVILDYHLCGEAGGGGRAISVLRKLAVNDHFNMVIVYTNGERGDIGDVFRKIVLGLSAAKTSLNRVDAADRHVKQIFQEWEDDEPEVMQTLQATVSEATYIKLSSGESLASTDEWTRVKSILETYRGKQKLVPALFEKWLASECQDAVGAQLCGDSRIGDVASEWVEEDANWIRTDRLFVTVVSKRHAPRELPGRLIAAIEKWGPTPHQLLMAKMRAAMDEQGVMAESGVLRDRHLQAGWMQEVFDGPHGDKKQTLKRAVDRHWEALGDKLRDGVDPFAEAVAVYIGDLGREAIFDRFVKIDVHAERLKIIKRLNEYACMRSSIQTSHLSTGHILKFGQSEYWLCLSPACDLVPGQKVNAGWGSRLGGYVPFMAVFLHHVDDAQALASANHNIYVFMSTPLKNKSFCFLLAGSAQSNPTWEQMFAKEQGVFSADGKKMSVSRVSNIDNQIKLKEVEAEIVGQLRYEYALNLLQRLGMNLSRIGLDYHSLAPDGGGEPAVGILTDAP